jgi:putative acyl-CoA dehydrogenase
LSPRRLIDQLLMQNVLAGLCLETGAAVTHALHLARGFDEAPQDEAQSLFVRLALAAGKYWVAKRDPAVVGEALECLCGGYVKESPMPRLYRDASPNAIREDSDNVQALDMLRAVCKEPGV